MEPDRMKNQSFSEIGYKPQILRNVKEMSCQLILSSTSSHREDLHPSITWFDGDESNTISSLNKKLFHMTQEYSSLEKAIWFTLQI